MSISRDKVQPTKSGANHTEHQVFSFGPFQLLVAERLLRRGEETVSIGGRALEILSVLIEKAPEVVSRRELLQRIWPDMIVDEANLRVHVAALRKTLGCGRGGARYIVNVPGRGYSLVVPVRLATAQVSPAATMESVSVPSNKIKIPTPLARMVGRGETIGVLLESLIGRRFLSVIGPGGIGKTTVAVSVAHALRKDFGDAVFFVDLGEITDSRLVSSAIALSLGYRSLTDDHLSGLAAFLNGKKLLIVLDSCEHVIAAVSVVAERLFKEVPQLHILTTSREALRVEGEYVHRLLPLGLPQDDIGLTAAHALLSPAVQLFMDRAAASGYCLQLSDADAPVAAAICKRLDGIALAIELAASRVGVHGIKGTAELLDSRFKLLWQGQRNSVARHQTLQALLDWSYNLLSDLDREVLRRLSVFVGSFTMQAVLHVVQDADLTEEIVVAALASLADKALIIAPGYDGSAFFRLLDATRAYAAGKLSDCGEADRIAKRHALYFMSCLPSYDRGFAETFSEYEADEFSRHTGNVRAALEWSFSGAGDGFLGIELAARATTLFLVLSLFGECQRCCERALSALGENSGEAACELSLLEALAISSHYIRGDSERVNAAISRGIELAEALSDNQRLLHLLAGLNLSLSKVGKFTAALSVAERYVAVAERLGSARETVAAEWMIGAAHYLAGNVRAAQHHLESGFSLAPTSGPVKVEYFGYDHRNRALVANARVSWLRGRPERALRVAQQAVEEATRRDHPITLWICLFYATPLFLWSGDLQNAEGLIDRLLNHAQGYSLGPQHAGGLALKGELMIMRGESLSGVEILRQATVTLREAEFHLVAMAVSGALARGLALCGRGSEAMEIVDAMLCEQSGGSYDISNLLRIRGEILLTLPGRDEQAAEEALLKSLECARVQGALSWELRSAIALARLWLSQGRRDEAKNVLHPVYHQFNEGFAMPDLKIAAHMLAGLEESRDMPGSADLGLVIS